MANSYMTVYGAEQYLNYFNDSLFKDVSFPTEIDRDIAINNIILKCDEFPILYTDLDFFKEVIKVWAGKYSLAWEKWVEGFAAEFSPIDNYDRNEKWTDTASGSSTTETQVSAMDSSSYQPKNKITSSPGDKNTHEGRIHGNIGVMKTTEILAGWMDFYKDYNIYDIMADTFVREFCILVY